MDSWLSLIRPAPTAWMEPAERLQPAGYKSKHKPCCVCKMTKKLRDQCIRSNDDGETKCIDFINAHKKCMRAKGFRVD